MSRLPDAHRGLHRALCLQLGTTNSAIRSSRSRPWASATFSGARHEFELAVETPLSHQSAQRFALCARDAELAIPGHIVADLHATLHQDGDAALLHIEALTVEERS